MGFVNDKLNLSLVKQFELLSLAKSSFYYRPLPNNDTWIMNEIYELWMKYPFYGYRRITAVLNRNGYVVNRKRILRLMKEMNLQAIYPKCTTIANKEHLKYPYLLTDLEITYPNHVWSTDITYIKMKTGFVYVVALIDVFSRYIVSWELAITMDTEFCITMLESALSKYTPLIVNSDQGCQFTSYIWTKTLKNHNINISMDGKGRCLDNVYIERFWRSLKQEEVYLKTYDNVVEARLAVAKYIDFYNNQRPHQSLCYKTPAEIYFCGNFNLQNEAYKKSKIFSCQNFEKVVLTT